MSGHMDGINNLPRWDPNNPTKYNYDWKNYDPADYAAFKAAQSAHDKKAMAEAKARSKEVMKDVRKAIEEKLNEAKQQQKQKQKEEVSRDQVHKWAKAGHVLYADVPSSAFQELKFIPDKDDPTTGTVVGTFWRGGSLTYSGPLDLDEFIDATAGSLGQWYNETQPF